jgi:FkbM family methyltransferase
MRNLLKHSAHGLVDLLERCIDFRTPRSLPLAQRLAFDLGRYELGTTLFFKRLAPRGVVFDIGAHVGYYSRLAARTARRVYAFEPDPENFALLERNAKHFPNITPLRMAVGEMNGEVAFYKVPDSTFRHSLIAEGGAVRPTTVECTTLDAFVAARGIKDISLVKIDVEQAEPMVFKGMQETLKQRPTVVFESGGQESDHVRAIAEDGSLVPLAEAVYYGGKRRVTNLVLDTSVV